MLLPVYITAGMRLCAIDELPLAACDTTIGHSHLLVMPHFGLLCAQHMCFRPGQLATAHTMLYAFVLVVLFLPHTIAMRVRLCCLYRKYYSQRREY
jgi:hypothetical protein